MLTKGIHIFIIMIIFSYELQYVLLKYIYMIGKYKIYESSLVISSKGGMSSMSGIKSCIIPLTSI